MIILLKVILYNIGNNIIRQNYSYPIPRPKYNSFYAGEIQFKLDDSFLLLITDVMHDMKGVNVKTDVTIFNTRYGIFVFIAFGLLFGIWKMVFSIVKCTLMTRSIELACNYCSGIYFFNK